MLRKMKAILAILLLFTLVIALTIPVQAEVPEPCKYFGKLTILGNPAPPGTVVVAMINGQERGRIVTQTEGMYGSTCMFGAKLVVQPAEGEYARGTILKVEFYVNGVNADQSAVFSPGTMKWRDLSVTKIPTPEPTVPPEPTITTQPTPTSTPTPSVAFNATPRTGYPPLMVTFTDLTVGGVNSWSWDFGDGSNSSGQNITTHLYRFPGNYSVNLTISSASGNSSRLLPEYIMIMQPGIVILPNQTSLPTDPDLDGYYEDLNGNGRLEFDDIMVYFSSMEWMMENPPFNHFDYNANGRVEFDDLYSLFVEI